MEWLERRVELVEAGGLEAAEARLTALLAKLNSLRDKEKEQGLQADEKEMVRKAEGCVVESGRWNGRLAAKPLHIPG